MMAQPSLPASFAGTRSRHDDCFVMNIAIAMLSYLAAAAALAGSLAGGAVLLARTGDPQSAAAARRVAPIPPRIADSIERRKPIPQAPATPPAATRPIVAGPTMQDANVALTQAVPMKSAHREQPRKKRNKRSAPQVSASAFEQGAPPASAVTTARSDNPY
jgi:hypothetical protein